MTSRGAFLLFGHHNSVFQLKFLMMRAFVKILKSWSNLIGDMCP